MNLNTSQDLIDYVKSMECSEPLKPGMYLSLHHGRVDPKADMEDWGTNGPFFGPLKWCHITYCSSINLCKVGDTDGTGPSGGSEDGGPLRFHEDMLFYDGVYYGDWTLEVHGGDE